jgi:plasmid stability protein
MPTFAGMTNKTPRPLNYLEEIVTNITVRNIPDELLDKLRTISILERRSLNSEILMALEKGLAKESESVTYITDNLSKDAQIKLWQNLGGRWKDNRSTADIISDIIQSR